MAIDLFEQSGSGPSPFAAPATLPEATPYPTAAPAFEEHLGGGPWYEAWTGFEHEQPPMPAAAATATRPVSPPTSSGSPWARSAPPSIHLTAITTSTASGTG